MKSTYCSTCPECEEPFQHCSCVPDNGKRRGSLFWGFIAVGLVSIAFAAAQVLAGVMR